MTLRRSKKVAEYPIERRSPLIYKVISLKWDNHKMDSLVLDRRQGSGPPGLPIVAPLIFGPQIFSVRVFEVKNYIEQ